MSIQHYLVKFSVGNTTDEVTESTKSTSCVTDDNMTYENVAISLGVLCGLLVLLLAIVLTGWLMTCWTMNAAVKTKHNLPQTR